MPAAGRSHRSGRSRRRVVQPGHQLGERALAGTGRADQGHPLAVAHHQVDTGQRRSIGAGVGERDRGDLDVTGRRQLDGVGHLVHVGDGVDEREQLVERRRRRLHRVVELAQLLHRLEHVRQQQHEGRHRAERHPVDVDEPAADAHDHRRRQDARELDEPEVPGADPHAVHVGVVEGAVAAHEAAHLLVLTAVGLHDPDAADALLQRRQVGAHPIAHGQVGLVRLPLEPDRRHGEDREDHERDEGQFPRHREQEREGQDQQQRRRQNCSRPHWISSLIDSMSAVMRDTSTPAFSRS